MNAGQPNIFGIILLIIFERNYFFMQSLVYRIVKIKGPKF